MCVQQPGVGMKVSKPGVLLSRVWPASIGSKLTAPQTSDSVRLGSPSSQGWCLQMAAGGSKSEWVGTCHTKPPRVLLCGLPRADAYLLGCFH